MPQGRRNLHLGQEFLQLRLVPVGQANGVDFPRCHRLFHSLVGFHVPFPGMVQQQHVDIANIQGIERLGNGRLRVPILAGIQLGNHKDFLPGHPAVPDSPAHCGLVVVGVSRVDQPPSCFEESGNGIVAHLVAEGIGAHTHNGHFIAAVERHHASFQIKMAGIGFPSRRLFSGRRRSRLAASRISLGRLATGRQPQHQQQRQGHR